MNHSEITSFIWGVADLIRDTFKRGKYQDLILALTVLRRIDQVLAHAEPTAGLLGDVPAGTFRGDVTGATDVVVRSTETAWTTAGASRWGIPDFEDAAIGTLIGHVEEFLEWDVSTLAERGMERAVGAELGDTLAEVDT